MLTVQHEPCTTVGYIIFEYQSWRGWALSWKVSATAKSHSLQAAHRLRLRQGKGGSAGAETRERTQPSPAGGPPTPPLQPPSSLNVIPSPEAKQKRKCQSSSQTGNLHAQTWSFLSWQSSSCGLYKDFPALSTSLSSPCSFSVCLSLFLFLSPTLLAGCPFGKLPQCNSFFPFASSPGVVFVWMCAHTSLCLHYFIPVNPIAK